MSIPFSKIKSTDDLYKALQDSKNISITTRDSDTNKIKRVRIAKVKPLLIEKPGGDLSIQVSITSTESDDTELLHKLYKMSN